ncbi:WD repeat-containing protein 76, partial [Tanacetum coccineum]
MQNMKKMKMKTYKEEISVIRKRPRILGPVSMPYKCILQCFLVDDKKLVNDIKEVLVKANNEADTSATASFDSVDVKSMKVKDKNFARVLPGKATEVKFYPTKEMRMVVAGNDCGNIGFWKIDSNEDEHGIYVYHPHPAYITGISVQSSSLSKIISSCRDGYVRVFDIEKESFDLVYNSTNPIPFSIGRAKEHVELCIPWRIVECYMDDSVRLISGTSYDVEDTISHYTYTSRFLSRVRGIWGWDDSFLMKADTKERKGTIDIISTDTKTSSYTLESEHGNAILCRLDAHPLMPGVVAGATSGGQVYNAKVIFMQIISLSVKLRLHGQTAETP